AQARAADVGGAMSERDAHPDEGLIHAWLDRQLDDRASATLEAHLQRCDECAERVAEARGLIAGASRILSSLDLDAPPASGAPAAEPWRPAVLPTPAKRSVPLLRLTPARSAIAAVLVVAVATAIVREHERTSSQPASGAAESAVVANAPVAAPMAGAAAGTAPAIAPLDTSAGTRVAQFDTSAGTRVAAARRFAKAQRETTVNADLARVGAVPTPTSATPVQQTIAAAKMADNVAGATAAASASAAPAPAPAASAAPAAAAAPTSAGIEAPQCYRVESATGAAATWGPVTLPFVLALEAPATSGAARVLTPAGQDADARAVVERRAGDSLLFTLRRIGYTGTLVVGAPGEVRAGVMRSAPSATLLESTVVTAVPSASERRTLRKSSAAQSRTDSAATSAEHDARPAVPVVVRKVGCH
ncbi:MAG TPA: zf-HC2 domain-containing protein, partial [Gemmatimonadaceae bacterium]|nr:zf-HC2 domain-containing protein [Gemmatimonadaceae bacterium]